MIYNNLELINKKLPIKYLNIGKIIILLFMFSLILVHILKIDCYYHGKAIIYLENKSYLKLSLNINDVNLISNNGIIIINDIKYKYKNTSISEINISNSLINYQDIMLEILELNEKLKVNNLVVNYKVLKEKRLLIKYIKEIMKG